MEKASDAMVSPNKHLTKEEQDELSAAQADGLTEYQQRAMEIYGQNTYYQTQINDNMSAIRVNNASVTGIKLERLKTHTMEDAQDAALVEPGDGVPASRDIAQKDARDEIAGDHEEHVDADESTGEPAHACVIEKDRQNRERAQPVDVRAIADSLVACDGALRRQRFFVGGGNGHGSAQR